MQFYANRAELGRFRAFRTERQSRNNSTSQFMLKKFAIVPDCMQLYLWAFPWNPIFSDNIKKKPPNLVVFLELIAGFVRRGKSRDGIAIDRRRRNRVTLFRYPAITIKRNTEFLSVFRKWSWKRDLRLWRRAPVHSPQGWCSLRSCFFVSCSVRKPLIRTMSHAPWRRNPFASKCSLLMSDALAHASTLKSR